MAKSLTRRILAEDEHIRIVYADGEKDFLLVTFNEMGMTANGFRFWGDIIVEKTCIAGLGIVSKAPNWFPKSSIEALTSSDNVKIVLDQYSKIVTYGFSMGGYAAIKYSKLFSAEYVLSLSPQISICPWGPGAHDPRFQKYYNSQLNHNMVIREEDIDSRVFIAYDPHEVYDKVHVTEISKLKPNRIRKVPLLSTGHHTAAALASSDLFKKIVEYLHDDREVDIVSAMNSQRKMWDGRTSFLARSIIKRKPFMAYLMAEENYLKKQSLKNWGPVFSSVGFTFFAMKQYHFALHCARRSVKCCGQNLHNMSLMSFAYEGLYKYAKALSWIDKCCKVAPNRISLQERRIRIEKLANS